jgi:hypothetical protein
MELLLDQSPAPGKTLTPVPTLDSGVQSGPKKQGNDARAARILSGLMTHIRTPFFAISKEIGDSLHFGEQECAKHCLWLAQVLFSQRAFSNKLLKCGVAFKVAFYSGNMLTEPRQAILKDVFCMCGRVAGREWNCRHFQQPFIQEQQHVTFALGSLFGFASAGGEQVMGQGADQNSNKPISDITKHHILPFFIGAVIGWFIMPAWRAWRR